MEKIEVVSIVCVMGGDMNCEPSVEVNFAQCTTSATPFIGSTLLPETNGTSEPKSITKSLSDPLEFGSRENNNQFDPFSEVQGPERK